jgi:ssDNA-binding Zn-finger/Zn-ribbon topoisomerase 1
MKSKSELSYEPGFAHLRRTLILLMIGWIPFGWVILWGIPKIFQSFVAGFVLAGAYAVFAFVTLFRVLLYQCRTCGRFMGVIGLLRGTCNQCKQARRGMNEGKGMEGESTSAINPLPSGSWTEFYRLKKSLILRMMLTAPFILAGSMLLPLAGIVSRDYLPLVFVLLLLVYAAMGRRFIFYPCPNCGKSYRGAQLYRKSCPNCSVRIGA